MARGRTRIVDPYYGFKETSKLCARFLTHLFACPDLPSDTPTAPSLPLARFIAYVHYRTQLQPFITFAALYLLQRLKSRFPAAQGSSGHRLFISAFMIASKVHCDNAYSNKSWSIVGKGMFPLREINLMEREMCSYLEWQLNIEPGALKEFEEQVRRDFKGQGPYPTYVLSSPAPSPMPSTTPYNVYMGGSAPAPSFTAPSQQPPSTSPSKPIPPPVPVRAGSPPNFPLSSAQATPETPNIPELTMSSPVSSASRTSPSTPHRDENPSGQVVDNRTVHTAIQQASYAPQGMADAYNQSTGETTLACVNPCIW